jgi:hypothetical protein
MRSRRPAPLAPQLSAAAVALAMDVAALEIVELLGRGGLRSILLKGPALARWLYDDPSERRYNDIDLLVEAARFRDAERALAAAGFRFADHGEHAHAWIRNDGASVDLHYTFSGVRASPDLVWDALVQRTEPLAVSGGTIETLDAPGRALIVALHAAHHGIRADKPYRDLLRAVERVEPRTWKEALELAERLDALPSFAAGLRLAPEGAGVADALGLADYRSRELMFRAAGPPPTAEGYLRLARAKGFRGKAELLAHELVPPPVFMRAAYPIARRGRAGLVAAYAWRPLFLLKHLIPSLRAWRRARRGPR